MCLPLLQAHLVLQYVGIAKPVQAFHKLLMLILIRAAIAPLQFLLDVSR
jgi:hypothetical protein